MSGGQPSTLEWNANAVTKFNLLHSTTQRVHMHIRDAWRISDIKLKIIHYSV